MPSDLPFESNGRSAEEFSVDPGLLEPTDAGAHPAAWPGSDVLAAVSIGGAVGAVLRYGLARAMPTDGLGLPWGTLTANVAGSLMLGLLTAVAIGRFPDHRYLRPLLGVGVLGSFTTYSTLAVELDTRVGQGHLGIAALYATVSVILGVAAAAAGLRLGRQLAATD